MMLEFQFIWNENAIMNTLLDIYPLILKSYHSQFEYGDV